MLKSAYFFVPTLTAAYRRDEANNKLWIVDEEASEIVRLIYQLRLDGLSPTGICDKLGELKILIPSLYMERKGYCKPSTRPYRGEYFWNINTVRTILKNRSYIGDITNFKTFTLSYKDKRKHKNPKDKQSLHTGKHEQIIDHAIWEQVQKTFRQNMGTSKLNEKKVIDKHMLAGYLCCSDCGANLNHKHLKNAPHNDYFSCGSNRRSSSLCPTTHHIRVDHIMNIITRQLDSIVRFARDFEDEFVKIVIDSRYKIIKLEQSKNKRDLHNLLARIQELDTITMSLYEDRVKSIINEDTFFMLSKNYEAEKLESGQKIKHLQKIVDEDSNHVLNVDGFLREVRAYTSINELTPEILRIFIDKVVIHHRVEEKDTRSQEVEIGYNLIGKIRVPDIDTKQKYAKSFARTKKENQIAYAI